MNDAELWPTKEIWSQTRDSKERGTARPGHNDQNTLSVLRTFVHFQAFSVIDFQLASDFFVKLQCSALKFFILAFYFLNLENY